MAFEDLVALYRHNRVRWWCLVAALVIAVLWLSVLIPATRAVTPHRACHGCGERDLSAARLAAQEILGREG